MSVAHDTQFGVVERRGIEPVPESERHGRPRDLFFIWGAANANVFSIVNGALLIALGLSFLQSVAVIVLGNIAGFFLLGLTSIQEPRTGTATFTINRAAFGRNGGRLLAFFNWLTVVGWDSSCGRKMNSHTETEGYEGHVLGTPKPETLAPANAVTDLLPVEALRVLRP
jgi:purine-cytosine permease-like protein